MSGARVPAGTREGALPLTSDGARESWSGDGPRPGRGISHVKGSPVDPDRMAGG